MLDCAVILPTLSRLGTADPFSIPSCFFKHFGNRGLFCNKCKTSYLRYTVITTGRISPAYALCFRIKFFAESHDIHPCSTKAGPIGGAGLAFPAGICSLIIFTIFFGHIFLKLSIKLKTYGSCYVTFIVSDLFDLSKLKSSTRVSRPKIETIRLSVLCHGTLR